MNNDDHEAPQLFGTRRAAWAVAHEISAARSDGARAYAIERPDRDDRPVSGPPEPHWIIELELAGVIVGRLCRDGMVRAPP